MMRVLCVFGSKSDEPVYGSLCNQLGTKGVVCSAHRDPDRLSRILKEIQADIIVAGAGLAAHLPGVCASQTIKPVIGLPIAANIDGLDSLLSIMQMPPGIPVLSSGVNATESIVTFLKNLEGKRGIKLVVEGEACEKALGKAKAMMERFAYPEGDLAIVFHDAGSEGRADAINVLCTDVKATDAATLLETTRKGLWVGLNRGDNAVLAAIALLERKKPFAALTRYREEMRG